MDVLAQQPGHEVQDLGIFGEHDVGSDVVVQAGKGVRPAQAAGPRLFFEHLDGLDARAILQEGGQRDAGQPATENADPHVLVPTIRKRSLSRRFTMRGHAETPPHPAAGQNRPDRAVAGEWRTLEPPFPSKHFTNIAHIGASSKLPIGGSLRFSARSAASAGPLGRAGCQKGFPEV